MNEKINNIARNTSYFTFALILQKIISFTYFALLARNLAPDDLGRYYFAISFTTLFAIFIDLGMANVLTREVAKTRDNAQKLLGGVLAIKIPLAIMSWGIVFLLVNLMGYSELSRYLVYLSSISMILDSFTLTFFSLIRGFHSLKFESISSVIFQSIVLISGFVFLKMGMSLKWLMGALAGASIFQFVYSAFLVRFKWRLKLKPVFDFSFAKIIIGITIPFAAFAVFQRVYMYFDSVLLSLLAGDRQVGLYQVAFKIIFALQFLPMAFTASLYPAFSSYWKNNRSQLPITFERALNYLIIISLPISFGVASLADKIIIIFKADYIDATLPLRIIIFSLIFIFINFPIGSLLNACDLQKKNTRNMGIALLVSIAMNLFLISKFEAVGASITVLVTNFLMFVLGIYLVPKIIDYKLKRNFKVFFVSLISAILMSVLAIYLKDLINIFLTIIVSGIFYFIILFLLGGLKKEDIFGIVNSFIKKKKLI